MWIVLAIVQKPARESVDDRMADEATLARMAQGDRDAVGDLYDRHARPVFSLALRILRDSSEAEDVVQDVFTQAWKQAARYDTSRGAVGAWLLNMTRSRAIDRVRSRRARPDSVPDRGEARDLADTALQQDMRLLSAEQVSRLRAALDALPPTHRLALELAYYEGLTHVEIAERLEEPLGTVKTRIRQAVIKLRESLSGL